MMLWLASMGFLFSCADSYRATNQKVDLHVHPARGSVTDSNEGLPSNTESDTKDTHKAATVSLQEKPKEERLVDLSKTDRARPGNLVELNTNISSFIKPATGNSVVSKTSEEGFFERLKNSFAEMLGGFVFIIFSIPILWLNERRSAQMDSLLALGQSQCETIKADTIYRDKTHEIVHLTDEMCAASTVADERFGDLKFPTGCVRLQTSVEFYQWIQHEKTETSTQEHFGGKKETITKTTYSYEQTWESHAINSKDFNDGTKVNPAVGSLPLGSAIVNCDRVEYGKVFILPRGLVVQCTNFIVKKDMADILTTKGGDKFNRSDDHYYCRRGDTNASAANIATEPQLGDARVTVQYVPEGVVTVVGMQADLADLTEFKAKDVGDVVTLMPYRPISRGFFGIPAEEETRRLVEEGKKGYDELARDASGYSAGPFQLCCGLCCGALNCVASCMAGAMSSEIFHVFEGEKTCSACFSEIHAAAGSKTSTLRLVGWLMMWAGFCMIFSPFLALLSVIPFLAKIGFFAVAFVGFFATVITATLIIALAYFAYRPRVTLMCGAVVVSAVCLFNMLSHPAK